MFDMFASLLQYRRTFVAVVLAVMSALIAFSTSQASKDALKSADASSLRLAESLHNRTRRPDAVVTPGEAPAAAPGYALILSALAKVSPALVDELACHRDVSNCNLQAFNSLFVLQASVAILTLVLVFFAAWQMSSSWYVAILCLVLTFIGGSYGAAAGQIRPLVWPQFLFLVFAIFAAYGLTLDRKNLSFAAGGALGLCTLFLPQLLIVVLVSALILSILAYRTDQKSPPGTHHAVSLVCGTVAVLVVVIPLARLSGYELESAANLMLLNLSERVTYNAMTAQAWLAGSIIPTPVIGPLVSFLFSDETVRTVMATQSGITPPIATNEIFALARDRPGSAIADYVSLMQSHIFGDALAYIASWPAVIAHGIWAATPVLSLLGVMHIKPLFQYSTTDGRWGPTAYIFVPVLVLLLFNTILAASPSHDNLGLVFLYMYATAYLVARMDILRSLDEASPCPA